MAKSLKLYDRTRQLIEKGKNTSKPVIIKGDLEKNRLYMVIGRTTFFSTKEFYLSDYYIRGYIKFLSENNFKVTCETKDESNKEIRCFKARLRISPNFDEKEISFRDGEIER